MNEKVIDTREGHLGVTLSTSTVTDGVRIDALFEKDLVYLAGLRVGMVITHVSEVGVYDHEHAMDIMNTARDASKKLKIVYLTEQAAAEQGASNSVTRRRRWMSVLFTLVVSIALAFQMGVHTKVLDAMTPPPPAPSDDIQKPSKGTFLEGNQEMRVRARA